MMLGFHMKMMTSTVRPHGNAVNDIEINASRYPHQYLEHSTSVYHSRRPPPSWSSMMNVLLRINSFWEVSGAGGLWLPVKEP